MRRTKWKASCRARVYDDMRRAVSIAVGTALLACSAPADDEPGGVLLSESGKLRVTTSSEPEERPVRGTNRILFLIEAAETGEPMDELELEMTPFMPSHGHGSSRKPSVTPLGSGLYRFDDVVLAMPGLWELHTNVSGAVADSFAPRFEVE